MNNCVTVRAYRAEIGDRVDLVLPLDLGDGDEMVDVDKSLAFLPVGDTEVHVTGGTLRTIVSMHFARAAAFRSYAFTRTTVAAPSQNCGSVISSGGVSKSEPVRRPQSSSKA
jgi:hypothetical protein